MAAREQSLAAALRQERDALRASRSTKISALRQEVQSLIGDLSTAKAPNPNSAIEPDNARKMELVKRLPTPEGARLVTELRALNDHDLRLTADLINSYQRRPVLAWRELRNADARLATLMTDLQRTAPVAVRESRVPDSYRRLLQNYFQALSDDFDDQEAETPAPPKK
jgi:hypothetical protein